MHPLRCCTLSALVLVACSRTSPAPAPAPTATATEALAATVSTDAGGGATRGATLRLATAIEEDAGLTPPPLTGKTVIHVGDSMVGGDWGLTAALKAKFVKEG